MIITDIDELESLLAAVRHLAIDGHEFMMIIMGSERAEKQLWKLLATLGLSQMVTIVPKLKQWRSVLAAGDIFIQPRPNKSFNPFLLEAMSVGAVVAGCQGGVDDLIIDDETCVVFDPDDELSIYGCLQRLFDRRELAVKLARHAQEHLRQNHSVSAMITAMIQLYRQANQ